MKKYTAIIDVGVDSQSDELSDWLCENKSDIEAISDNEGCGCCIDMYYILLKSEAESTTFISEASSTFDDSKLFYGEAKDELVSELL